MVIQPRPVAIKKAAERALALSPDASPLNPPIKSATFQRFLPDIHFILASRSTDGLTFFLSLDVPGQKSAAPIRVPSVEPRWGSVCRWAIFPVRFGSRRNAVALWPGIAGTSWGAA